MEKVVIKLKEDAYICGTNECAYYQAMAVDAFGNEYLVKWDLREDYVAECKFAQEAT